MTMETPILSTLPLAAASLSVYLQVKKCSFLCNDFGVEKSTIHSMVVRLTCSQAYV